MRAFVQGRRRGLPGKKSALIDPRGRLVRQIPTVVSQGTFLRWKPPTSISQTPANASQTPGNLSQTPGNVSQAPADVSQAPANLSQAPGRPYSVERYASSASSSCGESCRVCPILPSLPTRSARSVG